MSAFKVTITVAIEHPFTREEGYPKLLTFQHECSTWDNGSFYASGAQRAIREAAEKASAVMDRFKPAADTKETKP